MRAMAVTDYTAPLQLIDLPDPEVQPGSVLIRVLACGVCYSDLKTARGHMAYSATLKLPHVPGHEISGEVVEAGPETGFQAGDRVVAYHYWPCGRCTYCRMGRENLCTALKGWTGFTSPGGFEEFLAVPADRLLRVPDGITPEQAAPATCATGTAYRAVVTRGRVQPGETVLVLGVGGVGLQALQIARAAGARPLAVDIDRRKLEKAGQLGAAGGALAGEEAESLIRDHTSGLGADLVINTVGNEEALNQASRLVRRGGRVVGVGYTVGQFARIQLDLFVLHEVEFIGSRYALRDELERVLTLFAEGKVQPVIDDVLPLEAANEALERLERGEVVGRTVLRVA